MRSKAVALVVATLCIAAGLGVMLYPLVSTQVNNYAQSKLARHVGQEVSSLDAAETARILQAADRYNRELPDIPITDAWTGADLTGVAEYQRYLGQLNSAGSMGQIVLPRQHISLPLRHGTSEKTLQHAVGHLFGTSLPVGGVGTHAVLTGHTGLPNATLFDQLDQVKVGDAVYVRTYGRDVKYEVRDIHIVEPNDTSRLYPVADKDLLTLITCTPYGINSHRLLVTGERVPMDPVEADVFDSAGARWQWWMTIAAAITVVTLALLGWLMWRTRRKKDEI